MHPKSKDRSGNDKLISDTENSRQTARLGPGRGRGRQSPYARKLEAMRQTAALKEMIRQKEAALPKGGEEE